MAIYELDGIAPELPENGDYFIADTAVIIGKVRLKPGASVWFGAVLRGDNDWIEIGEGSNIQDGSILHTDMGHPLTVSAGCTVGHQAILHGCRMEPNSLIGMGAVVLNGAVIRRNSLVGAHAFVGEGKTFPENSLILGAPAKAVRTLDEAAINNVTRITLGYQANFRRFKAGLKRID